MKAELLEKTDQSGLIRTHMNELFDRMKQDFSDSNNSASQSSKALSLRLSKLEIQLDENRQEINLISILKENMLKETRDQINQLKDSVFDSSRQVAKIHDGLLDQSRYTSKMSESLMNEIMSVKMPLLSELKLL